MINARLNSMVAAPKWPQYFMLFITYTSIMLFDWIIAFHSTSWHLLISMVHFSRSNSRLPPYLRLFCAVLIDTAFVLPGTVSELLWCCFELFFIYVMAGVAWSDGVLVERLFPPTYHNHFKMCYIISVSVTFAATFISHSHSMYVVTKARRWWNW